MDAPGSLVDAIKTPGSINTPASQPEAPQRSLEATES